MRILMLSWEYPPRVHGGLGRHVDGLSRALAGAGHEVHVVANGTAATPGHEQLAGVRVHRPPHAPPDPQGEWLAEVATANASLAETAARVSADHPPDVLHAHDWLVAPAAETLLRHGGPPLVATVHATESGRHQGWLPTATSRHIHRVEAWLVGAADQVIVCSEAMRTQIAELFAVPPAEVTRIGNGVEVAEFDSVTDGDATAVRAELAGADPLIAAVGRLEYEKGVHVLVRAVRRLRRHGWPVHLAVAGTGTYEQELRQLAARLHVAHAVTFLGDCDRRVVTRLCRAADVLAVPSIYEPFGISALEAMAARTPLVAGDTGGLAELVDDGRTGLLVTPGDTPSLTRAVRSMLVRPGRAQALAAAARRVAVDADWQTVARRTVGVYERALAAPPSGRPPPLSSSAAPPAALTARR